MWEQIRSNKVRSVFVVGGMGALLVATGVAIGALLSGGLTTEGAVTGGLAALGVWLVLWLIAFVQGDEVMLRMARAQRIDKKDHPTLFNVVEEMSIASQLGRMPRVYVVDDPAPNAFATGRKQKNAAVSVTTGLLRTLDRDELQGVVAHEMGHIKNRDVALMVTAGVMLGAIVLLAEIGLRAMWFGGFRRRSRSSQGGGGGQAVVMIVAIVLMILAPILAQLIYLALSRRREYLADASGALFTRYPEGLASALEKIGGVRVPMTDQSRVTAPMYIVRPLRPSDVMGANGLFATHPPIEERIRILRAMGGGAGLGAYEAAFRKVKHRSVVGTHTLSAAEDVPSRARPSERERTGPVERARQASDAVLSASGYRRLVCAGCDAILKVPAEVIGRVQSCPRCGTSLERAYPAP